MEAEAQLGRGLNLLVSLPEGAERQQRELDLQSALVVTLMQTRGYAAPAVAETLARARQLCEELDRPPQFANVLYVQCGHCILRGELLLACQYAMEHLQLGEARNDRVIKSTACVNSASAWSIRGEFLTARAYGEQVLELYDQAEGATFARISPQDPQLTALITLSDVLTNLGYLDQARLRRDEAIVKARHRRHANTLALVLAGAWNCEYKVRSKPAFLLERAEELQRHCVEHGLPFYSAQANVYRGASLSALGSTDHGLALLTEGLAAYRTIGARVGVPGFLLLQADCYRSAGEPKEGMRCLDEAAYLIEATQIRSAEAGMYRRRGEFFLFVGNREAADACFHQAIDVARRQKARLWELQAASGLARLWREQGKRADARDLLGPISNWFTEGFDAPDLKEAKGLLNELA